MTTSLEILYRDDDVIAINKPSGLMVHRDAFTPRDTPACLQILRDQTGIQVHPVHRLDGGTSGVLLFAWSKDVLAKLMQEFMDRTTEKRYHAIVRGWFPQAASCDRPMTVDGKMQDAKTHFRALKYLEMPWANERFPQSRYSYIEATPETGRFHQIRRHANYLAHPIVGDTKHGDNIHNQLWRDHRHCHRLLLHASKLSVRHPRTRATLTISAPLPKDFLQAFQDMPWRDC